MNIKAETSTRDSRWWYSDHVGKVSDYKSSDEDRKGEFSQNQESGSEQYDSKYKEKIQ